MLIRAVNISAQGRITRENERVRVSENISSSCAENGPPARHGPDELDGVGMNGTVMRNKEQITF